MSWTEKNEWLKPGREERVHWTQLRRFLIYYRPYRAFVAAAILLALVGSVLTAVLLPVVLRMIHEALARRSATAIAGALALYLGAMLVDAAFGYVNSLLRSRMATSLNRDILLRYYEKILNLAVEEFMAFRQRTNLFQRVIDAMSVTGQFTDVLVRGGQSVVILLAVGTVVGTLSPAVLAVVAMGAAVLFAVVLSQTRTIREARRRSLAVNYPLVGKMTEVIDGLLTIKALAASVRVTSDVRALVDEKTAAEYAENRLDTGANQLSQVVRSVTTVTAFGISVWQLLRGALAISDVFALYVLTALLLGPIAELARLYQGLARLSTNVAAYYEVLDLEDEQAAPAPERDAVGAEPLAVDLPVAVPAGALQPAGVGTGGFDSAGAESVVASSGTVGAAPARRWGGRREIAIAAGADRAAGRAPRTPLSRPGDADGGVRSDGWVDAGPDAPAEPGARRTGRVTFRDVSFHYRGGAIVLDDLTLDIAPGEHVSLIGRSGVGKTTLIRVLLGFLQPQAGTVAVDDVPLLRSTDRTVYRRRFGVVSQNDLLFGTTLRENMSFGLANEVADDRLQEALRRVNLWDDVQRLPKALETVYSDDLFSGGQRQRLFVARALLRDPRVVVLDEPTSALDFESEARVMDAVRVLAAGRTTITIAHRLTTVRNADRVIVLDAGRVRATGAHQELYDADSYYRALCDFNSFVL